MPWCLTGSGEWGWTLGDQCGKWYNLGERRGLGLRTTGVQEEVTGSPPRDVKAAEWVSLALGSMWSGSGEAFWDEPGSGPRGWCCALFTEMSGGQVQ